jgi:hypothetical protein
LGYAAFLLLLCPSWLCAAMHRLAVPFCASPRLL